MAGIERVTENQRQAALESSNVTDKVEQELTTLKHQLRESQERWRARSAVARTGREGGRVGLVSIPRLRGTEADALRGWLRPPLTSEGVSDSAGGQQRLKSRGCEIDTGAAGNGGEQGGFHRIREGKGVRHCLARHGIAWHCLAWLGIAWHYLASLGMA